MYIIWTTEPLTSVIPRPLYIIYIQGPYRRVALYCTFVLVMVGWDKGDDKPLVALCSICMWLRDGKNVRTSWMRVYNSNAVVLLLHKNCLHTREIARALFSSTSFTWIKRDDVRTCNANIKPNALQVFLLKVNEFRKQVCGFPCLGSIKLACQVGMPKFENKVTDWPTAPDYPPVRTPHSAQVGMRRLCGRQGQSAKMFPFRTRHGDGAPLSPLTALPKLPLPPSIVYYNIRLASPSSLLSSVVKRAVHAQCL